MKEKLYGAEGNYSSKIWENIKKDIPITTKTKARSYWMAAFLIAFSSMIMMVQQYPNWKVEQQSDQVTEVEALECSKFILSPSDLASRQIYSTTNLKPTLQTPTALLKDKVLSTQTSPLEPSVPTLSNIESNGLVTTQSATTNQTSLEQTALRDNFFSEKNTDSESEEVEHASKAPLYTLAKISKFNIGLKIPEYNITAKNKNKG